MIIAMPSYRRLTDGLRGACLRLAAIAAATCLAGAASGQNLRAEIEDVVRDYIRSNPQEMQQIIRDYLASNPEVLQQIIIDTIRKQRPAGAVAERPAPPGNAAKAAAIKENAGRIFSSPHQVTLGNPQGDVTLVEFFDYSCGFCKRALADKLELLRSDTKLKLVLKEFPILGPGSIDAARIGIAVRMQDPGGTRYLEFHKRLLSDRAPPSRERALEVAKDSGLDVGRIEKDAASDEVRETIEESIALARLLGVNGTPSYVVGESVIVGAVGISALKARIEAAREKPAK